jgi:hypothetical protein
MSACSRQVTSTPIHIAKPGRLALLAVTHASRVRLSGTPHTGRERRGTSGPARAVLKQALAPQARARFKYHPAMGLFRRRPPRQEYAVSAEVLWGALKAGLPSVTSQATFDEESRRVEWTMDLSAFDWPQRMSARVEASRDGGAVVTVEGKSAYGTGAKSIAGPGRRRKAAAALLAAVSAVVSQSAGAPRPPADDDGYRYWTGREWTLEPRPPAPPGPPGWPPQHSPPR